MKIAFILIISLFICQNIFAKKIKVTLKNGSTISCECGEGPECTAGGMADSWNNSPGTFVCCNRGTAEEKCFNKDQISGIGLIIYPVNDSGFDIYGIFIGLLTIALAIYFKRSSK